MVARPQPALRADAARNRDAIVVAARQLFAERGLDAPMDEIARRADVGNATLYRRFPTREELVEAVFLERMTDHVVAVDLALQDPDAWAGIRSYLIRLFHWQAEDRGFAELLITTAAPTGGALEKLRIRASRGVQLLIDRAHADGRLRADFCLQDVALLLMANAGVVQQTRAAAPDSWQRVAALVLDGLQQRAATPAPEPPTAQQLARAMARRTAPPPPAGRR